MEAVKKCGELTNAEDDLAAVWRPGARQCIAGGLPYCAENFFYGATFPRRCGYQVWA